MSYFTSLSAFLHMGGYADYVWPAYAIVIIILGINLFLSISKLKKMIKQLRYQYANDT